MTGRCHVKPHGGALDSYIPTIQRLEVQDLSTRKLEKRRLNLSVNALGPVNLPIFAYRGSAPGPIVGIVSTIHGNELNGIPVIQQIFARVEAAGESDQGTGNFAGALIGAPVLNVPGFLNSARCFDGHDLNRLMPGNPAGDAPQQYASRLFEEIVMKMDYVFDLHTASAGRQNAFYVRVDLRDPVLYQIACDLGPQIIVHNSSPVGSLRGCAQKRGIKALTVEIGNPSIFQDFLIARAVDGICNALTKILGHPPALDTDSSRFLQYPPLVCCRSYWLFSQTAGILRVYKNVTDTVFKGDVIAEIHSVFGEFVQRVAAPNEHEMVIFGIEANPVAKVGNRIVHIGVIGDGFMANINDGHL